MTRDGPRHLHLLPDVEGFDPSRVPVELVERLYRYRAAQELRRWPSPRTGDIPEPPWPSQENPMLEYLLLGRAMMPKAIWKVLFSAWLPTPGWRVTSKVTTEL